MDRFVKIVIGVLILVYSYSCKKELTHYYVSDSFKHWTVFEKGSYWIYKNDSTLVNDSVFVKANPKFLEIPPYSSKDNFTLEWIEMSYSSVFLSTSQIVLYEGGMETFSVGLYNRLIYSLISSSSDNFVPSYNSTYQLLSQDSVFFLGQEKFYHIVNTQFTQGDKKWTCWLGKDIGLIKVIGENTDPGFSWSLLRYHIVK